MKFLSLIFLLVLTNSLSAQWQAITYKDKLTFSFPGPPEILDTLRTRTYFYQANDAVLFCNIARDPNPGVISSAEALETKFDSVIRTIYPRLGNHQDQLSETVNFKGVKARHFKAIADAYQGFPYFETYTLFIGNEQFQFNALTKSPESDVSKKYFDSIRFHDAVTAVDDATTADSPQSSGNTTNFYLLVGLGIILLIGLVVFFLRRRKLI